jgi:hypothetical protein
VLGGCARQWCMSPRVLLGCLKFAEKAPVCTFWGQEHAGTRNMCLATTAVTTTEVVSVTNDRNVVHKRHATKNEENEKHTMRDADENTLVHSRFVFLYRKEYNPYLFMLELDPQQMLDMLRLSSKMQAARANSNRSRVLRLVLSASLIFLVTKAILSLPGHIGNVSPYGKYPSPSLAGRTVISTTETRIPFIPDDPEADLDFITLTTL